MLPAPHASGAIPVLRAVRIHEALLDAAVQEVAARNEEEALRIIENVFALLEHVGDRRPYARILIVLGTCLLDLGHAKRAKPLFVEAIELADALPDVRLGSEARFGLERASQEAQRRPNLTKMPSQPLPK